MPLAPSSALTPGFNPGSSPFISGILGGGAPRQRGYGERLLDDLSSLTALQGISLPLSAPLTAAGGAIRGLSFGLLDPTQEIEGLLGGAAPPETVRSALEITGEIGGSFVPYIGAASAASRFFKGADVAARLLRGSFTFAAPEILDQALHGEFNPKHAFRSAMTGATFSLPLARPLLAPTVAATELLLGAKPIEAGIAGGIALLLGPMEGKIAKAGAEGGAREIPPLVPVPDTDLQALRKIAAQRLRKATPEFSESRTQFTDAPLGAFKQQDLFRAGAPPITPEAAGLNPIKAAVEAAREAAIVREASRAPEFTIDTKIGRISQARETGFATADILRPKSQVEILEAAAAKAGAVTDDVIAEVVVTSPTAKAEAKALLEAENLAANLGLPAGVTRTEAKVAGGIDEVLFTTADNSLLGVRFPEPGKALIGMTQVPKGRRNMGQFLKLWKSLESEMEARGVTRLDAVSTTDARLQRIMDRFNARTPTGEKLRAEAAKVKLLSQQSPEKLSSALIKAMESKGADHPDVKTIHRALAEAQEGYVPAGAPVKSAMPPAIKGPEVAILDETNPFVQRAAREKILEQLKGSGPTGATKVAQLERLYVEARSAPTNLKKANEMLARQRAIRESETIVFANEAEALSTFGQELQGMRTAAEVRGFMENLPDYYRRGPAFAAQAQKRAKSAENISKLIANDILPVPPSASSELADFGLSSAAVKGGFSAVNTRGGQLSRTFKTREGVRDFIAKLEAGLEQPRNLNDVRALGYPRSLNIDYQSGNVRITDPTGSSVYADSLKEAVELVRRPSRLLDSAPEMMPPSLPRAPGPGNIGGRGGGQAPPNCPIKFGDEG